MVDNKLLVSDMTKVEDVLFWLADSRKSGAPLPATTGLPVVGQVVSTIWASDFSLLSEVSQSSFMNLLAKHEWKIKGQLKILC